MGLMGLRGRITVIVIVVVVVVHEERGARARILEEGERQVWGEMRGDQVGLAV